MSPLEMNEIDRRNILNNKYALKEIQTELDLNGVSWNNDFWMTKQQVADLFEVDVRTVENYLSNHIEELSQSGYQVLTGNKLKDFKLSFGTENVFGTKTTKLGLFSIRAVLNLAMLLTDSDKARDIRSRILDVTMRVVRSRSGNNLKYINQRDSEFLEKSYEERTARQEFTNALNHFVDMGTHKYGYFTNQIYKAIFKENAKEYRNVLKLQRNDKTRETMYSEVLRVIASFEKGLAFEIKNQYKNINRKLSKNEVDSLLQRLASHPSHEPHLEDARIKMASRDKCFRDAHHINLKKIY